MPEESEHRGGTAGSSGRGGGRARGDVADLRDIDSFQEEADRSDEAAEDEAGDGTAGLDLEAPEADAAEQRADLLQQRDEPIAERPAGRDGEADPADIAEQRRVVGLDEEDYR